MILVLPHLLNVDIVLKNDKSACRDADYYQKQILIVNTSGRAGAQFGVVSSEAGRESSESSVTGRKRGAKGYQMV